MKEERRSKKRELSYSYFILHTSSFRSGSLQSLTTSTNYIALRQNTSPGVTDPGPAWINTIELVLKTMYN